MPGSLRNYECVTKIRIEQKIIRSFVEDSYLSSKYYED